MPTDENWKDLSWQERREMRFRRWFSPPNAQFFNSEAERSYKERVARFIKAITLEEPDRVPVYLHASYFPAFYAESSLKRVMYDYDEMKRCWRKFLKDFDLDIFQGPGMVWPARMLERIEYRLHLWPGHGLGDDVSMYQYVEGEYMKAEEYNDLIRNPTDYLFRSFLPRYATAFEGFGKLSPLTASVAPAYFTQFADPEVVASVQALLDAAREGAQWMKAVGEVIREAMASGFPGLLGGLCSAPYDYLGDKLRGTKGVMMDMYRRPEKLCEAMERLVPVAIDESVKEAERSNSPIVHMPLHKGTGGFMSNKQFETFYWPTLKKVIMGLIEEGLVPLPFAEGDFSERLEIIDDLPKGTVVWHFERMDMVEAKRTVGRNECIMGNVPASILCTGKPKEVEDVCRKLIETCAPGGGYILSGAAGIDKGDPDNLRAIMAAAKKYGTYT